MTTPNAQPQGKLGIIAGGGDLPLRLVEACNRSGRAHFMVLLEGMAEKTLEASDHAWLKLGAFGKAVSLMKEHQCKDVTFVGKVARPNFRTLQVDGPAVRLLPKIAYAAARGDDALLRVIVQAFEDQGLRVVGPETVMGALLSKAGPVGTLTPSERDREDIAKGYDVAKRLGELDVGQGAIVCEGLVLAVEAAEGTDAMLERVAALPEHLRGVATERRGVLVKTAKPQQERRIDLPAVGVATVERAAQAGLAGIAVETGAALVVDRNAVAAAADRLGLFVVGVDGPN